MNNIQVPYGRQNPVARETFAITHLSKSHNVEYGKDKRFSQIADIPNSYIFADDIESPSGAKLPLWMLGFLY